MAFLFRSLISLYSLFQMGDERNGQSPAGLRTILQIEQLADTLQCKAQILEALDNSQPAQLRLRIEAKTAASALFCFDEPQLFVVANRARGDAGLSRRSPICIRESRGKFICGAMAMHLT